MELDIVQVNVEKVSQESLINSNVGNNPEEKTEQARQRGEI